MVNYLEQLIAQKEYQKALDYAEKVLLQGEQSLRDMMVINYCLMIARRHTDEAFGAQVAGEMAVKLARELEEWDYYGIACMYLGWAFDSLCQWDKATSTWYDYIAAIPHYTIRAAQYEATVWFNLATRYIRNGEYQEALKALTHAGIAAERLGDERKAHGVRHGLISTYLSMEQLAPVLPLLAKTAHYLRHHQMADDYLQSRLYHRLLRVEFALKTNRLKRAQILVQRSIPEFEHHPTHMFHLCMLMSRAYERMGNSSLALYYAMRARVSAIRAGRYDREAEAADFLYRLAKKDPDALQSITEISPLDLAFLDT